MGSTLSVSEIQGLTSGSNANTITVGSGHTLHAAGHVVQFQSSVNQNASTTTWSGTANSNYPYSGNRASRTYTLARTVTITPTSTSSILYCTGVVGWTSMAMTATMGHGSIITRNDDGAGGALSDTIDNSDYPWYAHNYLASSATYFPVETVIGIFSPSSTSEQTIRLRPYVYVEGGNTAVGNFQGTSLFVMEIAQ